MMRELQGQGSPQTGPANNPAQAKELPPVRDPWGTQSAKPPAPGGFNINLALAALIATGNGDKKLKEIAAELSELTVKQFAEVLKNVKP